MLKITKKYANPQTNPPISHPAKRWFSAGCSSAAAPKPTQPIMPTQPNKPILPIEPIMPTMPIMPIVPIMPISIAISPQAAVVLQPLPPIKKSHLRHLFSSFPPFVQYSFSCPVLLIKTFVKYLFPPRNPCYICNVKRRKK